MDFLSEILRFLKFSLTQKTSPQFACSFYLPSFAEFLFTTLQQFILIYVNDRLP